VSSLLGGDSGQSGVEQFRANDIRLMPEWTDHDYRDVEIDEAWTLVGFANNWWPGLVGLDASGGEMLVAFGYDRPELVSGASGFYGITGVTRDAYGTVIPGATVRLFRTSDSMLVSTVTSDPVTGVFMAPTPYYPDAHFLVASKSGVPDVAGTSVQTLIAG